MTHYIDVHGAAPIADLMPPEATLAPDERTLLSRASINNAQFVRLLADNENLANALADLPVRLYVEPDPHLDDDWGKPIVYMSSTNKYIGTAPGGKPFFFSAGPDGKYLTIADNLYSYEPGFGGQ